MAKNTTVISASAGDQDVDTPSLPRPATWKQRNHVTTPEEIAAVQAPFGAQEGPYPAATAAKLVLEVNGGDVDAAVNLFMGYLNKFDGNTTDERVHSAATQDHDRGISGCAMPYIMNGAEPVKPQAGAFMAQVGEVLVAAGLSPVDAANAILAAVKK